MVYFLHAEQKNFIKIGFTDDGRVARRLKEIKRQLGWGDIRIIGAIQGDLATEKKWHRQWKEFHWWREWFWPEAELVDAIMVAIATSYSDACNRYFHIARQEPVLFELWKEAFLLKNKPRVCALDVFYDRFKPGFINHIGLLRKTIPFPLPGAAGDPLRSHKAYDIVYQELLSLMPSCDDCPICRGESFPFDPELDDADEYDSCESY